MVFHSFSGYDLWKSLWRMWITQRSGRINKDYFAYYVNSKEIPEPIVPLPFSFMNKKSPAEGAAGGCALHLEDIPQHYAGIRQLFGKQAVIGQAVADFRAVSQEVIYSELADQIQAVEAEKAYDFTDRQGDSH